MIHNKKSNQSVESDSELIQTLELAKKDIPYVHEVKWKNRRLKKDS